MADADDRTFEQKNYDASFSSDYSDYFMLFRAAKELADARAKYGHFASAHEGHSVILEEVRELEEWVFMKQGKRDPLKMQREAIQLAAMALKFAADVSRWVPNGGR